MQLTVQGNDYSYYPLSDLNPGEGLLRNAISENLIRGVPLLDGEKKTRLVAQMICLVGSLGANASYVPISNQMPGGDVVRKFCVISNFISFFELDLYAIKQTTGDIWGPRGESEALLLAQTQMSAQAKKSVIAISFIMAILAQVPIAYPALKYDGNMGITAMLFLLWGGLPIPLNSLYESCNWILDIKRKKSLDEVGQQIEVVRDQALQLIEEYQDFFERRSYTDKLSEVSKFKQISLTQAEPEQIDQYLSIVLNAPPQPEISARHKMWNDLANKASLVMGSFLTASLQTGTAIYTKVMTETHITNNPYAVGLFTTAVVVSSTAFYGRSIVDTTKKIFSSALNLCFGVKSPTIAEQVRFKTTLALKLTGVLLNGFALGATFVIWDDFFKDQKAKRIFFQVTELSALFLTLSAATSDFIDEAVKEIIQFKGSADEKDVIKLKEDLSKLYEFFRRSSILDIGEAVSRSGEGVRDRLLAQSSLSLEMLRGYIRSEAQASELDS